MENERCFIRVEPGPETEMPSWASWPVFMV
jgi:hypothetical protein